MMPSTFTAGNPQLHQHHAGKGGPPPHGGQSAAAPPLHYNYYSAAAGQQPHNHHRPERFEKTDSASSLSSVDSLNSTSSSSGPFHQGGHSHHNHHHHGHAHQNGAAATLRAVSPRSAAHASSSSSSTTRSKVQSHEIVDADFDRLSVLGTGASSVVFHAKHLVSNTFVALKVISKDFLAEHKGMTTALRQEINLHRKLRHHHIVRLFSYYTTDSSVVLVMEPCEGTLADKVVEFDSNILPADIAQPYLRQTAKAIAYLHEQNFIHRDIKLDNILLDGNGQVKLADFGWAKLAQRQSQPQPYHAPSPTRHANRVSVSTTTPSMAMTRDGLSPEAKQSRPTVCGTLDYISPEMLEAAAEEQYQRQMREAEKHHREQLGSPPTLSPATPSLTPTDTGATFPADPPPPSLTLPAPSTGTTTTTSTAATTANVKGAAAGQKITTAVDVWAFGVLIYELLCGVPPFYQATRNETVEAIRFHEVQFPLHVGADLRGLISQMLHKDPRRRPSMDQVLEHPFFAKTKR